MSYQLCYIQAIVPTTKTESIPVDFINNVDELLHAQGVLKRCIAAKDLIRYVVEKAIRAIRECGIENRHWQIVNTVQSYVTTYTPDNRPIETVPVTEAHDFDIPLYEEAIELIKSLCQKSA